MKKKVFAGILIFLLVITGSANAQVLNVDYNKFGQLSHNSMVIFSNTKVIVEI